jgi:CRISP-associated protein Cas1
VRRSVAVVNPARLSIHKKRLRIQNADGDHFVPFEDLGILVLDHEAIDVTGPLLGELGEQGVAVIVCNGKHLPSSYLMPYPGNVLMAQTMRAQMDASLPSKKRLWQAIIQEKIRGQGRLLIEQTGDDHGLGMMAYRVRSGDPTNVEGQAAAIYFAGLFGGDFFRVRQREMDSASELNPDPEENALILTNAMLNYGYAVIRAMVARAVVGAGLHPALGLWHRHRNNAFSLADDLMEPLRPLVDREVCRILIEESLPPDLTPALKRRLLGVLTAEVRWDDRQFPLDAALEAYAANVRRCLLGEIKELGVPGV